MYVRLLEIPAEQAREIGARMRLFVSGSARCRRRCSRSSASGSGTTILERYGMSETLMNISNPYVGERRPGSVGLPLPGVSVRLLDEDGQRSPMARPARCICKAPMCSPVTGGAKTRRAPLSSTAGSAPAIWRCASPDGYYTLCGRRSDLIISGGFNIYPREIEEFLEEQEEVAEAAVAGVPDRVRGEVPVAYVVVRRTIDPLELETRCREKLASFKVPRNSSWSRNCRAMRWESSKAPPRHLVKSGAGNPARSRLSSRR